MARILVIDDHPADRDLLVTFLGYYDHIVFAASSGLEGLTLALIEQPDLIIADIKMPAMDGFEFARRIRADPELSHTRLLLYSAVTQSTHITRRTAELGGAGILAKPTDPDTILATVNGALDSPPPSPRPDAALERANLRLLAGGLRRIIAKHEQAEAKLREQADLLDQVSDAIISTDLNFTIKSWNAAAAVLYGWPAQDVIGRTMGKIVPTKYLHDDGQQVRTRFLRDGHWRGEVMQQRKDGTLLWILSSVSMLKNSVGESVGAVAINRDITERKRAEDDLQRSAARLQILADVSRAFAEAGGDYQILLERIARMTAETLRAACSIRLLSDDGAWLEVAAIGHYDPAELVDMRNSMTSWRIHLSDQAPAATAARLGEYVFVPVIDHEALRGMLAPEQQAILSRFLPHSMIVTPLRIQGRSIGSLSLARSQRELPAFEPDDLRLAQDLTDRAALAIGNTRLFQQAQRELVERQRIQEELRESHSKLRLAIQAANVGLWDWDLRTDRIYYSPDWKGQIGYADDEIADDFDEWRHRVHPDDLDRMLTTIESYLQNPWSHYEEVFRFRHKNGSYRWILAQASLLVDEDRKPYRMLGSHVDITERMRAEVAVRRQAEDLALLNASLLDVTRSYDLSALLHSLVERAAQLYEAQGGSLFLCHAERQELRCVVSYRTKHDYTGTVLNYGEGVSGVVAQTGESLIVDNYQTWPGRPTAHEQEQAFGALISVPMIWQNQANGVIHLFRAPGMPPFTVADLTLLTQLANHAAIAVENDRLLEAERQARTIAETLCAANLALTQSLDLDTVLAVLLECLKQIIPYDSANVMLLEDDTRLSVAAMRGYERWTAPEQTRAITFDTTSSPHFSALLTERKSVLIADINQYPDWERRAGTEHVMSWFGIPLVASGTVIGLYSVDKSEPGFFTVAHLRLAEALASQAGAALQNARLFAEIRQSREHLQTLSHRLVNVQEIERREIARELHDEIGQVLTGLKLMLDMAARLPPGQVASRLAETRAVLNDLMVRVRNLSLDLRPTILDDMGLLPALQWHFERYTGQTGVQVICRHNGIDRRFRAEIETTVYRVVQEALTNVARYAHVHEVRVRLLADQEWMRVRIDDQGQGFDLERIQTTHTTSGLAGMRERAVLLGGELTIESSPGEGTHIIAELPLAP
jgi:PAS domain S-box-containing protein